VSNTTTSQPLHSFLLLQQFFSILFSS